MRFILSQGDTEGKPMLSDKTSMGQRVHPGVESPFARGTENGMPALKVLVFCCR